MIVLFLFLAISSAFGTEDPKNCTKMEGPKIFRCIQHLNEIRELAYTIDIYEKESADKIKAPCAALHKCYVPLKCEMEAGVITMIDKIVDLCDAVAFHHTPQFYECDDKLSARNTTCLQEWEPFPDPVADVKKTEELQKEACKNFFGKDDCLKEEISDWCGLDMWEQFRKHYLALNRINEACDFN
ncbi:unnamed protein product [Caenorhabditis brenneri]